MKIAKNVTELIGRTPLLRLEKFAPGTEVVAKLECMNPLSSAKDRAGYYMIKDAEEKGILKPGATIVEPTSGNTGVGLAYVAAVRGYQVILTMPDSMSVERRNLLAALGAHLVLTPAAEGMSGAVAKAEEIVKTTPGAWMADQFGNPANAQAHYETTGPEIWKDTDGEVAVFVAGMGTGGTVTGTGRYLKEQNPNIRIVAVEPAESPLLTEGKSGPHGIQGIGANFVPAVLDRSVVDEVMTVTTGDAMAAAKALARQEGILVGISSGAAAFAARELAARPEYAGKRIVALLPDTGERYLSTGIYKD